MKLPKAIKTGVKICTKNFIIPAVDKLVELRPEFLPSWIIVRGFYGSIFDIQQEKINEFVNYLMNNPEKFSKNIIMTKPFQEGFVITFEEYIKQRNEDKRKIIQEIFFGFTDAKYKKNFELERMYDLLNKISPFQFHVLRRIIKMKQIVIKDYERNVVENDYDDIKYLEYLGIVNSSKKSEIDTNVEVERDDESGMDDADATSEIVETETFNLSVFGEDFVKFIK